MAWMDIAAYGPNEVLQINMIYCMGDEADDIVKSFTSATADEKKYTKVKEKFD